MSSYTLAPTSLRIPVVVIDGRRPNPYRDKVVCTYNDPVSDWRKVLGDSLLFQWGLYDDPYQPQPDRLGEAGIRYFARQLELAGLSSASRAPMARILDLGCGWGYLTQFLARRFPECPRIDAVNISPRQLGYSSEYLARQGLADRVRLYLCDGQDVDLLPAPEVPYDLAVIRGVFTHFMNEVFENSVKALAGRMRSGGTVILSDTLFKGDLSTYASEIPDTVDRLACGNRKTPEYFAGVIEDNGFSVENMRILPSNVEVIRWFRDVKHNIETSFVDGVSGPLEELRVMADNMSSGLAADKVSAYSIIAIRRGAKP